MPTTHSITAGAVLQVEGATVHAQTRFEQEVSIHPETGKPLSEVTSLVQQLIVLDDSGKRRIVSLVAKPDGTGVYVLFKNGQAEVPVHEIKWR